MVLVTMLVMVLIQRFISRKSKKVEQFRIIIKDVHNDTGIDSNFSLVSLV